MRALAIVALAACLTLGPSCVSEPAPLPQARLVVDTDLPVPQLASRLRVDVFDGRGTWRSSRDFALRGAEQYPASFALFLPDEDASGEVVVRLRLRPDGAERDYRGERYRPAPADDAPPGSVVAVPAGDGQPRLVIDGGDRTPVLEPLPELTVDRLVRLSLGPGTNMSVRVTLRAICMGRMASLAEAAGCVDEARLFAAAGPGDGPEDGRSSVAATLLDRARLTPPVAPAHAVAIAGGPLVLGSDDLGIGLPGASVAPSFPPLGAVVSGFAIDREEVSVVRMRAAVKSGFVPGALQENAGSLAKTSVDSLASCTYRSSPDPADPAREFLPVTCVGFDTARAFCQWEGGDLPTETQWEYAASMAGRAQKTRYPWGNDAPICEGVVFARFDDAAGGATGCHDRGFAFGLRGAPTVNMDVTAGGVRGLAGGASEWVRGAPFAYDSACFRRAGIIDPACDRDATEHVVRGGSFASTESVLVATFRGRMPVGGSTPAVGFRCVHGA